MPSAHQCPKCGAVLRQDAQQGLCPRCLLTAALNPAAAATAQPTTREPLAADEPSQRIGRYKILQKLGEGGCGIVYMAEQTEPVRRKVALKVIKLGMDTRQVIARFEAERQALALMDHPNIARVLDAGATETGRPYFVMELVKGIRITDYCDQHHLPTAERLALFTQVCQAIQHAHQKGIIHRDIKPSNVLVTLHDGVPVPKVIDFGIAKATEHSLTEKTVFTAFGQFMGTPAYMSPEQAELSGLDIDTRSDIYALGVLLYELLTGRTPFDAKELLHAGLDEMRRRIREEEPMRPSTRLSTMADADLTTVAHQRQAEPAKLTHFIRGDLDWIVMKCLEKDRNRRYETANGLAMDLRRHLNNEPVVACPPSAAYRFQKMVRRNKLAVGAVTAVVMALMLGLGIATWQFFEKNQAYQRAMAAEKRAQDSAAKEEAQRKQAEANEKTARTEASKSKQVSKILKEMLGAAGPTVARGRDATVLREMLEKTYARVSQELTNQPEVQGDIYSTIGTTFMDMGDHHRAITNFEQAVRSYRLAIRGDNRNLAYTLNALGFCQSFTEDVAHGSNNAWLGLEMARRCADQETLFKCLLNYAGSFEAWGMGHPKAAPYVREAYELKKKVRNDTVGLATAQQMIAWDSTNAIERVQLLREAYETLQKQLPPGHPETVQGAFSLGQALVNSDNYEQAETVLKEALAGFHKTHEPNHPYQSIVLRYLVRALLGQNKMQEAETELRQHMETFPTNVNYFLMLVRFRMQHGSPGGATEALPRDLATKLDQGEFSSPWAISLLQVGANEKFQEYRRLYLDAPFKRRDFHGKMDTAKVLLLFGGKEDEVERSCRFAELAILSATDEDRFYLLEELNALLDLRRGRFAFAKAWAARHVAKAEEWKPRLCEGHFILALACARLNQPGAARAAIAIGDELLRQHLPDGTEAYLFAGDEWILARYLGNEAKKALAALPASSAPANVSANEPETPPGFEVELEKQAQNVFDYQLSLWKNSPQTNDLSTADVLNSLANRLAGKKRYDEAETFRRQALQIQLRLASTNLPALVATLGGLAATLDEASKYPAAELVLQQRLELERKLLGKEDAKLAGSLGWLAAVFSKDRKYAEAEPLLREKLSIEKQLLGGEHATTLGTTEWLAYNLADQGKWSQCEAARKELVAGRRKLLGNTHPETLRALTELHHALAQQGKLAEAQEILQDGASAGGQAKKQGDAITASSPQAGGQVGAPKDLKEPPSESEARLNAFVANGQWQEAASELAKAIEWSPTNHSLLRKRGEILGRIGRWKEAAASLGQSIEAEPNNSWPYLRLAPILLLRGDVEGYRQLCQRIVARFSGSKNLGTADTMAKACTLHPRSGVDLSAVAESADTAVTLGKASEYFPWFALCKSLTEYRQEHFAGATEWAQKALTAAGQLLERDAAAYLVLAMAQMQLKQPDAARASLAKGGELVDGKIPKLDSGDLGAQWVDVLIANLLMREAKTLITNNIPQDTVYW